MRITLGAQTECKQLSVKVQTVPFPLTKLSPSTATLQIVDPGAAVLPKRFCRMSIEP
jgi:hypothetical protein